MKTILISVMAVLVTFSSFTKAEEVKWHSNNIARCEALVYFLHEFDYREMVQSDETYMEHKHFFTGTLEYAKRNIPAERVEMLKKTQANAWDEVEQGEMIEWVTEYTNFCQAMVENGVTPYPAGVYQ